jgi:hypothetical protein
MVNTLSSRKKGYAMHLLFPPVLASGGIYIGGGLGLVLVIIVAVLLLRR